MLNWHCHIHSIVTNMGRSEKISQEVHQSTIRIG
ncbi:MAG: hypothetical protein JNL74_20925 [Fibrobacteres bacterium]|nr:hypothetical protein [Fibrobacterota bacterium]